MRGAFGVLAAALAGALAAGQPEGPPAEAAAPGAARASAAAAEGARADLRQEKGYPFTDWDGRFVFVRIYFEASDAGGGGFGGGFRGRRGFNRGCGGEPCWHHDYPYAETNLTGLLGEISTLRPFVGGNVISASDPMLHRFPLAWLAEPGHWTPDTRAVENVRAYLLKGGFLIFDDFGGGDTEHLVGVMQQIVPELRPIRLDGSEPIFHAFFDVAPENLLLHSYRAMRQDESYWGYFEDNDKSQRQLAILNADNDIGEFIEYNETGFSVVDMTNEAYKLAVNYIVYALTH